MDPELPPRDSAPDEPAAVPPPPLIEDPPIYFAEPAPPPPPVVTPAPPLKARLLAGIESGILGAAVMILWFALDSLLERQYWWAMLNLWGASVYHNRVFSMGFGIATLAGVSTHFFLHGVAGGVWGAAAARMSNYWLHLASSMLAAAVWYWLLMHVFWPAVAPVVSRIAPMPATPLAYFLFGAALSRTAYRARQFDAVWQT